MAKHSSKNRTSGGNTWVKRDAGSGQFVVGRDAFSSISAVEGIKVSKVMDADLRRTDGMTDDKRRSTLASKYGKKK